jgi:hypothetical protein
MLNGEWKGIVYRLSPETGRYGQPAERPDDSREARRRNAGTDGPAEGGAIAPLRKVTSIRQNISSTTFRWQSR